MKTFAELDLVAPIQRALADLDYTTPTPIQAQAIPAVLEGRDLLGCAQTGTGKTAAFALPILSRLGEENRKAPANKPFVLILAPTRELAVQIGENIEQYGEHLRLRHTLIYGGVSQRQQVRSLKRGTHILVATPGRLIDLMDQGHVSLKHLETFVLDEADRMLDMGFMPSIKRIMKELPKERQSLFFSATLPPKITQLSRQLLRNPVAVTIEPEKSTLPKIDQWVRFVDPKEKQTLLRETLGSKTFRRGIVFTRTKRGADNLTKRLTKNGVHAVAIHGDKSQNARQRALNDFRDDKVRVLVATDVAARGIDVDGVTHVVNYDLPTDPESYVHRIGRTGRAGATGMALTLCTPRERGGLKAIERLIGQQVPRVGEQQGSGNASTDTDETPRHFDRSGKPNGSPHKSRRPGGPRGKAKRKPNASASKKPFHKKRPKSGAKNNQRRRSAKTTADAK